MNTQIPCPSCNQALTIDDAWTGQQVNCPVCQAPFLVPAVNPVPVAIAIPVSPPTPAANGTIQDLNPAPQKQSCIVLVGGSFILVCLILVGIGSLFPKKDDAEPTQSQPAPLAQKAPSNETEAKKALIGTWIYIGVGDWEKWILKADGTSEMYFSSAAYEDWNVRNQSPQWKVKTGRYQDTGEKYYGVDIGPGCSTVLLDNGRLRSTIAGRESILVKNGKDPFKK